jgi:hypothetical protein
LYGGDGWQPSIPSDFDNCHNFPIKCLVTTVDEVLMGSSNLPARVLDTAVVAAVMVISWCKPTKNLLGETLSGAAKKPTKSNKKLHAVGNAGRKPANLTSTPSRERTYN